MVYKLVRGLLRVLYGIFYPLEIHGAENIPREGPVLICANHISLLDPPAVGIWVERQISFFAKEELFRIPLLGTIIRKVGAIPVRRGAGDRKALAATLEVLKNGGTVAIFPEGTRIKSGVIEQGKKGAAFFALRSDAVVIPAAILGPYRLFRKTKIIYGPPIDLSRFKEVKANSAVMENASEVIMQHIRNLASSSIERPRNLHTIQ
ncbi:lysophospholipid acyltransferase family protein [Effusibacillus lacus]|uniref:lysophospholipid acyltransferase family protein n=1 Tax=Effusibacillus lacus TaxID=1348429 RepID=UPI000BB6F273|nr:lysophospholipid acyltransferase family protein [Effusibacillus lacus]TCS75263.1 1-acyl-sn-glycerol-3-phosphate acyltransferase [Effusibacillus lacus]